MIWGRTAADAVAQGDALPLAGGPGACLGFAAIERGAGAAKARHVTARDLSASTDSAIRDALDRITSPRPPIAGLDFRCPLVMCVVNVTPDSFSDGGDFDAPDAAAMQARRLADEGARIADIGGESTRPGAEPVDEAEELRRIVPVLEALRGLPVPISIDTRKARVMERAIGLGAAIVNDVSALTHDPAALETAARLGAPVVLMHAQGDPRTMQDAPAYRDVLLDVYDFLDERIAAAEAAGIPRQRLIADPGIGFGKTLQHNLALLSGAGLFHGLGVPLLVGVSRKRMIGAIAGETEPKRRMPGSIGAALGCAAQGVQIFRAHDASATRQALDCWLASTSGFWPV
jgi:dihydropteroate synthase